MLLQEFVGHIFTLLLAPFACRLINYSCHSRSLKKFSTACSSFTTKYFYKCFYRSSQVISLRFLAPFSCRLINYSCHSKSLKIEKSTCLKEKVADFIFLRMFKDSLVTVPRMIDQFGVPKEAQICELQTSIRLLRSPVKIRSLHMYGVRYEQINFFERHCIKIKMKKIRYFLDSPRSISELSGSSIFYEFRTKSIYHLDISFRKF